MGEAGKGDSRKQSACGQKWQRHIEQWKRRGKTQVEYCAENGLSLSAFRWWVHQLRVKELVEGGVGTEKPMARFLPVKVNESRRADGASRRSGVAIGHRSGCVISLEVGFDGTTLREAMAVLEEMSC